MADFQSHPDAMELIEAFELLPEDQVHEYLIDLGRKLPRLSAAQKTEEHRVQGCLSNVWIVPAVESAPPHRVTFEAESDAFISAGTVALVRKLFNGRPAREVLDFDIEAFFKAIHLEQQISVQRRNGLYEMVKRIRRIARVALESHAMTGPMASIPPQQGK